MQSSEDYRDPVLFWLTVKACLAVRIRAFGFWYRKFTGSGTYGNNVVYIQQSKSVFVNWDYCISSLSYREEAC